MRYGIDFGANVTLGLVFEETAQVETGPGLHRISLPVSCEAPWLTPRGQRTHAQVLLTGRVGLDGYGPSVLGSLESGVLDLRSFPVTERVSFTLTGEQLLLLERCRDRGDLRLRLDLQMTLLAPPAYDGLHPVRDQQVTVRVNAAAWESVLEQAGVHTGITLWLRSPLTDPTLAQAAADHHGGQVPISHAVTQLRQARAHLREQQYQDAVAACRLALEVLEQHARPAREPELRDVPTKQRSQDQRWQMLFRAAENLTQPAHHADANAVAFTWTRQDAEGVLAVTAALLNRQLCDG